jgi:hypothetical protein
MKTKKTYAEMKESGDLDRLWEKRKKKALAIGLKRSVSLKRASPIKKVSKTMASKLKLYSAQRKLFLENHPICALYGTPAVDVHHIFGRGKYLLDESMWLAVSREAHDWIHSHANEARAKGYLKF